MDKGGKATTEEPINAAEQEADESLCRYLQNAASRKIKITKVNDVRYRIYLKTNGEEITQVLVPKPRRKRVLRLAHEYFMGGHLGMRKPEIRVLPSFYWPGLTTDVERWCKSCDACQRTIPNGKVTKVPLGKMPIMTVPFQRVAIDLVGPISPSSSQGNRYVLTVVDYVTRWLEAIALPGIETERIAEALISIFSRVSFLQEILSDRGSQFTSQLMAEVCRLISVRQCFTSPYHPMTNGLNERFNGTFKQMLRKMCQEKPSDWDRYLPAILIAYREVQQSSTGFSPFELLYGRSVKGPMGLLKGLWTGEQFQPELFSTYQYVVDLKN